MSATDKDRLVWVAIIVGLLFFFVNGGSMKDLLQPSTPTQAPQNSQGEPQAPSLDKEALTGSLEALSGLPARQGSGSSTPYDRDKHFGSWVDHNNSGCNAAEDTYQRYVQNATTVEKCRVGAGTIADPYTGKTITFDGSPKNSGTNVEHIVSLSDAWHNGADKWTQAKRVAIANDPDNLVIIDSSVNQSKSDRNAAEWNVNGVLSENCRQGYSESCGGLSHKALTTEGACFMVQHQIAIKAKYGLSVTAGEKAAMQNTLKRCGA